MVYQGRQSMKKLRFTLIRELQYVKRHTFP